MGKFILGGDSKPVDMPIQEAPRGFYVVTDDDNSAWVGAVVAVACEIPLRLVRLTDLGSRIGNAPDIFAVEVANESGMRVRPLTAADNLKFVD